MDDNNLDAEGGFTKTNTMKKEMEKNDEFLDEREWVADSIVMGVSDY